MTDLYNPLPQPSSVTQNQIAVYLSDIVWSESSSLLSFSVGIRSAVTDLASFGLRLHFDGTAVTYSNDTNYSLLQSTADTADRGFDSILTQGIVSGSGHLRVSDEADEDANAATDSFVKANWVSTWDANSSAMQAWPGSLSVDLYEVNFIVTDTSSPLAFGFSAATEDLKQGYQLSSSSLQNFTIDLSLEASDVAQRVTLNYFDSSGSTSSFPDHTLVFSVLSGSDVSTTSSGGVLSALSAAVSFDSVELSGANYADGINISDAVAVLKHIVGLQTLENARALAADVNLDGVINISDAVGILKHIVGLDPIESCSLVDSNQAEITSIELTTDAEYSLIQRGDVDLSATFEIL